MPTSPISGPYSGRGRRPGLGRFHKLPDPDPDVLVHPGGYLAPPGLVAAVNVSLDLGMPLLLTGEPGCGKSQLAHSLAYELDLAKNPGEDWCRPLVFTVKSNTQGRDLFYTFDPLGRLRAGGVSVDGNDPSRFLRFEALGLAILRALGRETVRAMGLADCLDDLPEDAQRSVVLVDQIDNAPVEVANDIVNEIGRMSFEVPELFERARGRTRVELKRPRTAPEEALLRPVVIITSNLERPLPDSFLRRCVYYHLDLPPFRSFATQDSDGADNFVTIEGIVERRLRIDIPAEAGKVNAGRTVYAAAISFFRRLREQGVIQKPPSIAELLNWMQLLEMRVGKEPPTVSAVLPLFRASAAVTLFKHKEDQERAERLLQEWLTRPGD